MKIKKAVFPVAGFGTRFLPATKSTPKEMLPVVDKPLIQYAVEEASKIGVEEFIFITHHAKGSIDKHFQNHEGLFNMLAEQGKDDLANSIKDIGGSNAKNISLSIKANQRVLATQLDVLKIILKKMNFLLFFLLMI